MVTYPGDNPTTPTAVVINANSSTANFGLQPESTILPTTPNPAPFAGGGNAVVEGLYRNILGRDADPAGLANWDARLKAGESATQVANQGRGDVRRLPRVRHPGVSDRPGHPPRGQDAAPRQRYRERPLGLTVTAENGSGNTTYTGSVTLSLSGGTPGAKLGDTVPGTAVKGVAAFTGLTIDTVGKGYTLTASSGTLTSATIPGINVVPAPVTATKLVVTTPPASVTPNTFFGLTVAYENVSGIIDTTFNSPVTLVLSGGTGAVLGGTLTVNAVKGSATFSNLTFNTAATSYTYTLTASSGDLTSAPVTVTVTNAVAEPTAIPVISFQSISTDPQISRTTCR